MPARGDRIYYWTGGDYDIRSVTEYLDAQVSGAGGITTPRVLMHEFRLPDGHYWSTVREALEHRTGDKLLTAVLHVGCPGGWWCRHPRVAPEWGRYSLLSI